ncbi:2Fe-2S iron-sulfur cluster-binding protein [Chamaesiphon minutus]|uniref:Aerobic-type carbon monoxide dehydrogenase, small subunit CoxS/CutS-like protein n=1 Tax=Chamaesiphon minutus (strain ATCC 27169 / PCC 6605) TaxID=1173020 RepID=K9UC59_CHAP6|nr:2Fe-2S iron-sulfur cluster-binding protein [Chamaesiphon minutus]AFY92702.1 aerobic-type carbon monoxide dehydrogenase, small subunit CoxS/CutS-like protein [Chamaesiphon minutus PCC 6605]
MNFRFRRRRFGQLIIVSAVASAIGVIPKKTTAQPRSDSTTTPDAATSKIKLRVNGKEYSLQVEPRVTLLDTLRDRIGLTGTKKGCGRGQCGACTVLVNGQRINSCLALSVMYDDAEITTIEGLARGTKLHPIQAAFIKNDGLQCGYCTPGQICSAVAAIAEAKAGTASAVTADVRKQGQVELTDIEIRERMSGNLCRCGAYAGIVAAVKEGSQANS